MDSRIYKNRKLIVALSTFMVLVLVLVFARTKDENYFADIQKENAQYSDSVSKKRPAETKMPKSSKLVASFDDRRNASYYLYDNRLIYYDKASQKGREIPFGYGYDRVKDIFLSPMKSRIFVVLDMGTHSTYYICDGLQLWVINTLNGQKRKLIEGFKVEKRKGCIVVGKVQFCHNSKAPLNKRRWRAHNHYFDFTGKVLWMMDDYDVMKSDFHARK